MKKTLLSLALFGSLMTLTGCFKGCNKDKEKTTEEKKEEGKDKSTSENTNAPEVVNTSEEQKSDVTTPEPNLQPQAEMDRPDEYMPEEEEFVEFDDYGPDYGPNSRYI